MRETRWLSSWKWRLAASLLLVGGLGGALLAAPAMAADATLVSAVHVPPDGSAGKPLYVALHGLGSDEHDLLELAPLLPQNVVFASLRAPYTLIPGHYAWFASRHVGDRLDGDPAQIQASEKAVLRTVDALVAKYHVDPHRIVLFGFSQGAIMSYDLALAAPTRFEGIGILSGAFFDSVKARLGSTAERVPTHVFIGHGLADQRIPPTYAREAADWWRAHGARVELHMYPAMQHEISQQELTDFKLWLQAQ
ncbi:alpha/beta hydrolase [Frateuria aurantia]